MREQRAQLWGAYRHRGTKKKEGTSGVTSGATGVGYNKTQCWERGGETKNQNRVAPKGELRDAGHL